MQELLETRVRSLGQEDPLEEEMATHSSILAWEIPETEEPGKLQSMGSQESDATYQLNNCWEFQDTAETVRSGKRRQVSEETGVSRIRRGTWFHAQTHIQWRLEEPRGSGL